MHHGGHRSDLAGGHSPWGSRARPPARLAHRAGMGRGEKAAGGTPPRSAVWPAHAPLDGTSLKTDNAPSPSVQRSFRTVEEGVDPNMPLILDPAAFQTRLAALPVATYQVGETVLAAGTRSGRLLVLKTGAVEVMKDGMQIAEVSEPGAVFGELSMLLDQPHTADIRALEVTEFHVAEAASLLTDEPATLLYVTVLLARRLDATNRALIEVKRQLQTGQPRSIISRTVEKAEELLNYSGGASLVYAGYPYDPHESAAP
jgi:CRP/FNR family cyclic AMP-dependent transcriptional regulator